MMEQLKTAMKNFKFEAEHFFVTKFVTGPSIEKMYSKGLDVIYNLTGTIDPTKGIVAYNPRYGQGKSFFFDVVQHRHRRKYGRNLFMKTTARELCNVYVSTPNGHDPEQRLMKFIHVKMLFIDDIGDELKEGKERSHYNNKLNVIRAVLLKRYELWLEHGWRTYATTNLTINEIGENYDGRVADRLLQMTYFEHFDFLDEGSFRQTQETRQLEPEEIEANRRRLQKPKTQEREKLDVIGYFNDLINEPDEYFEGKDTSFWTFTKDFLMEQGLLTQKDLDQVDEKELDSAQLLVRRDARTSARMRMSNAPANVRSVAIDTALGLITSTQVYNAAENMIARRKFMELRKSKHVFK